MNDFIALVDVSERLKSDFDWTHSFIRECYLTTDRNMHEFIDDSGRTVLGDTQGWQQARLAVACAGNPNEWGVEFVFYRVKVFSIQPLEELVFEHEYDKSAGHTVRFSGKSTSSECWINAESVLVRFLGRSYHGIDLLLGYELPTANACEAERLDACFRQCGHCKNAWAETPNVVFSRCPSCGLMTKLAS